MSSIHCIRILTKSISRFARNTVDSLTITRELKAQGVEVFFEKENISSMDVRAELMFTILSSIAQEESRSISENVRWGVQRSMEAGKVKLPWKTFLGYEKGPDGLPKIVEEEAKVVRDIYQWFLDGMTMNEIARKLTSLGVKTPRGKDVWIDTTVRSILKNEKYKGDARLMKTYIDDFLNKQRKINKGERKQWYIHDSHDAIIDPETFELVQKEIARRCLRTGKYYNSPFSNKIICGHCGSFYCHKVWHAERPTKKDIWRCQKKYQGTEICPTPKVEEWEIIGCYLIALNRIVKHRENYTREYKDRFLGLVGDNSELSKSITLRKGELQDLYEQIKQLVANNAKHAQDQDAYEKEYNALYDKINQKQEEVQQMENQISANRTRREEVKLFLKVMDNMPNVVNEFNIQDWHRLVEDVKVTPEKTLVFRFRNGHNESVRLDEVQKNKAGLQSLVP